jgi:protein-tyrosine phosphatase
MNEVLTFIRPIEQKLQQGKNVAIHCRQGIGRASMLAACILAASGMNPELALEQIRIARRRPVPDTDEQKQWIVRFAREMLGVHSQQIDDGITSMKAPST